MAKKMSTMRLLAVLVFAVSFSCAQKAYAAFSLSVTPYEGGNDIRFGNVASDSGAVNKEMTVRITTDIAKQYRVYQMMLSSLSTPDGSIFPLQNLAVYGIRGSNRQGVLNVEQAVPMMPGKQLLYTSASQGLSDTFTLVYTLTPGQNVAPGAYMGRISFILEPLDASQQQVTVILNIYATIDSRTKIEITTVTGSKEIRLSPAREESKRASVSIAIKGGLGKQYRILQAMPGELRSSDGNTLDWNAVEMAGRGARTGMVIGDAKPVSQQPQMIYVSSPNGAADSFEMDYALAQVSGQKVGRYQSKLQYFLETLGGAKVELIDSVSLIVDNPKVFDLSITPEDPSGRLEFRNLKAGQEPRRSEVTFTINSNIGKPYQVLQNVYSELVNTNGNQIPGEHFTIRGDGTGSKGSLKIGDKSQVKKGDTTLFVSDSRGSSDSFKLVYELDIPKDVLAGDYSTRITYSLIEL